jgi:hypothetical protein
MKQVEKVFSFLTTLYIVYIIRFRTSKQNPLHFILSEHYNLANCDFLNK